MKDNILEKETFNIKDLANIVKKETQTIRSWENKGIIKKPSKNPKNWREYTKKELIETLETILNYPWERKVIKNTSEIQYIIDTLRDNNVKHDTLTLLDNKEE